MHIHTHTHTTYFKLNLNYLLTIYVHIFTSVYIHTKIVFGPVFKSHLPPPSGSLFFEISSYCVSLAGLAHGIVVQDNFKLKILLSVSPVHV